MDAKGLSFHSFSAFINSKGNTEYIFLSFCNIETYHLSLFSLFVLCEGLAHPFIVSKKLKVLEILAMAVHW